mmetsp:Transcript_30393/g.70070  ORF Transcript_30393/g.70070 Transcript_30393/m.70070 type:complete len:82 (+) Transcript_30393:135-380(+)
MELDPYVPPLAYDVEAGVNGVLATAAAEATEVSATGALADSTVGGRVDDTARLPFLSQGLGGAACIKVQGGSAESQLPCTW